MKKNLKLSITAIAFLTILLVFGNTHLSFAGGSGSISIPLQQEFPKETITKTQENNNPANHETEDTNTQNLQGSISTLIADMKNVGLKDIVLLIISTIAGGILGFGTVILVEKLKEPNLIFEVGSEDDDPIIKRKFIHIKIRNLDKKINWLPITTSIASLAKSTVKIDKKQFIGRWTSKAEPLIYGAGSVPIAVNPNDVLTTPREDICPTNDDSEAVQIAIGVKYENEDYFYGFNNESYLHQPQLKNPKYQFGLGKFNGEITVITLGKKYVQKFIVHNNSKNRINFRLELVD